VLAKNHRNNLAKTHKLNIFYLQFSKFENITIFQKYSMNVNNELLARYFITLLLLKAFQKLTIYNTDCLLILVHTANSEEKE